MAFLYGNQNMITFFYFSEIQIGIYLHNSFFQFFDSFLQSSFHDFFPLYQGFLFLEACRSFLWLSPMFLPKFYPEVSKTSFRDFYEVPLKVSAGVSAALIPGISFWGFSNINSEHLAGFHPEILSKFIQRSFPDFFFQDFFSSSPRFVFFFRDISKISLEVSSRIRLISFQSSSRHWSQKSCIEVFFKNASEVLLGRFLIALLEFFFVEFPQHYVSFFSDIF